MLKPTSNSPTRAAGAQQQPPSSKSGAPREPAQVDKKLKDSLIGGSLFGKQVLYEIFQSCQRTAPQDFERALKRAGTGPMLTGMLNTLREGRLTINFDLSKVEDNYSKKFEDEIVNSFGFSEKPGELQGTNSGRASMEKTVMGMRDVLQGPYGQYGEFGPDKRPLPSFQRTSRPIYGALDFMHADQGGAPTYGLSYIVLKDYMKHVSSYTPTDSYALSAWGGALSPDKVACFTHFERLIAHCQDDLLGYSCLKALKDKTSNPNAKPHKNYGYGGRNNYIEAQIHSRIFVFRDAKEIHLDAGDWKNLAQSKRQDWELFGEQMRKRLGHQFLFVS
ncbi:MAG: DUF3626 domain-containing protein [Betaproteobacteria bacterium]